MTQQTYIQPPEPHLGKVEKNELRDSGKHEESLNNFFKDAAQVLDELGFYLGPIRYSVQHRTFHDQQHNGHGTWTFACLRRERRHHLIVPDKRYILTLEIENIHEKRRPFDFAIYTHTHFDEIKTALKPLADKLSSETGRKCTFRNRLPEEVPGILAS